MKLNQSNYAMSNRITSRQKLLLLFILLSMVHTFFAARSFFTIFAQTRNEKEKIIKKNSFENEPIEFLNLESDGKPIKQNEKFTREDDWLKDFTIKFRNVSSKSIVYVSTVIGFPETDSTGNRMFQYLKYGVNPLVENNNKDEPKSLVPNETGELILSTEKYTSLKNFLGTRRHSLKDLTEINLTIVAVYFDDGTHWSAGTTFRPDTNRPGKFVAVEKDNKEEEK